jgi:hypothetical protein
MATVRNRAYVELVEHVDVAALLGGALDLHRRELHHGVRIAAAFANQRCDACA